MGFFLGCLGCTSGSQTKTDDRDFPKKVAVGDEAVAEVVEVVKRFSWAEIEKMTMNFKQVIGVGGYSTIYLAKFHDSSLGAIKIYISSERLNQVFKNELEISQKLHHANIVKLLGYCDDRDEGVLVYEYIPKGNLQEELHKINEIPSTTPQNNKPNNLSPQNNKPNNLNPQKQKLSWKQRISIAYQLAQALEYLHENGDLHIVHGDIKSSNILLDEFYNCKLCDFGFSKMGFSSMIKPFCSSSGFPMMGSPGYMDPHYLMTGIASKKSDLYSYGVLLLEIITGFEPFVCSGVDKQVLLTSIVRTKDRFDVEKVVKMVDPWILNDEGFDIEQVKTMATIAGNCLHHLPSLRPSASNICKIIREMM